MKCVSRMPSLGAGNSAIRPSLRLEQLRGLVEQDSSLDHQWSAVSLPTSAATSPESEVSDLDVVLDRSYRPVGAEDDLTEPGQAHAPRHIEQGSSVEYRVQSGRWNRPSLLAAFRIALISACEVGSPSGATVLCPSATTLPCRSRMTAPI